MPRFMSGAVDWALILVAFGFLLFILFSPTGSFVRTPMQHTVQAIEAREEGGLLTVHAAPADQQGLHAVAAHE